MMQRSEIMALATSHADAGLLCSESVLLAISELLRVESELIPRIATGFGAGIGRKGEVCGALAGGVMGLGLAYGRSVPETGEDDRRPYWFSARLAEAFRTRFGGLRCVDLLGLDLSRPEEIEEYHRRELWATRCREIISETAGLAHDLLGDEGVGGSG